MKTPSIQQLVPKIQQLFGDEKKRVNLLVALGVVGMLLLALSEWLPQQQVATVQSPSETPSHAETQAETDYAAALEARLQALIEKVDGAGQTQVMVTLESGAQKVYATDKETGSDGSGSETHILLENAAEPALVERTATPAVLGVAVVCAGGGDAGVQYRITELVNVLTDVGASHITVTKMAAAEQREGQQ